MKLVYYFLIGFIVIGCNSKKDPNKIYFDNAAAYSDFITTEQVATINAVNSYIATLNNANLDSISIALKNLQDQSSLAKASVQKMADYKGDTIFKKTALDFFTFIEAASKNELKQMGDLVAKDTSITTEEIELISKLSMEYTANEKMYNDKIINAQDEFAKKFGLTYK